MRQRPAARASSARSPFHAFQGIDDRRDVGDGAEGEMACRQVEPGAFDRGRSGACGRRCPTPVSGGTFRRDDATRKSA